MKRLSPFSNEQRHAKKAVNHLVVTANPNQHTRLLEPPNVGLSFVTGRVVLGRDGHNLIQNTKERYPTCEGYRSRRSYW